MIEMRKPSLVNSYDLDNWRYVRRRRFLVGDPPTDGDKKTRVPFRFLFPSFCDLSLVPSASFAPFSRLVGTSTVLVFWVEEIPDSIGHFGYCFLLVVSLPLETSPTPSTCAIVLLFGPAQRSTVDAAPPIAMKHPINLDTKTTCPLPPVQQNWTCFFK